MEKNVLYKAGKKGLKKVADFHGANINDVGKKVIIISSRFTLIYIGFIMWAKRRGYTHAQ